MSEHRRRGRFGVIAAIETGGTKVVCGLVDVRRPDVLVHERRFPTTSPGETLGALQAYLEEAAEADRLDAIGIASFGPVNVEQSGDRYGWITRSTKTAWSGVALLDSLPATSGLPTALLSDVSGAALGEQRLGAGRGIATVAYATFGTGVGIGVVRNGEVLDGDGYPELGHLLVRRHPDDDFAGVCPFHGDCLEGLASGPAVPARWGADSSHLPAAVRSVAYDVLGYYIAQAAAVVAYAVGARRVVVGGGAATPPGVLDAARARLESVTGGPGAGHSLDVAPDRFLVRPQLGDRSGVLGAACAAAELAVPVLGAAQ